VRPRRTPGLDESPGSVTDDAERLAAREELLHVLSFEFRGVHVDGVKACFYAGHVYETNDKLNGRWGDTTHFQLPSSAGASSP
jgi:hypothetical protein